MTELIEIDRVVRPTVPVMLFFLSVVVKQVSLWIHEEVVEPVVTRHSIVRLWLLPSIILQKGPYKPRKRCRRVELEPWIRIQLSRPRPWELVVTKDGVLMISWFLRVSVLVDSLLHRWWPRRTVFYVKPQQVSEDESVFSLLSIFMVKESKSPFTENFSYSQKYL